jgi:MFS family permease|tara:strand:+ start:2392 stop:3747 length:1356 start_codon:yes stop_codon:yes gene_type:complete
MSKLPALDIPNVRNFVRFRIFFNARYYYPIFTILFLDFGLSLEQFTMLNVLWALTIVFAEVPSGALADVVGRRNLLLAGAILMMIEMAVLLVAPLNGGTLTLTLFAINRIASGLAEAMVSGADEALAYDSLKKDGDASAWTKVLEHLGKRMSPIMGIVMVVGALTYDSVFVNSIINPIGWSIPKEWLIRAPVTLTFLHSLVAIWTAWKMREPEPINSDGHLFARIGQALKQIWKAVRWLGGNRFVLFVILGGLILDSVARQFVILASEYYRLISIPEFAFGFLSAGLAAFGFVFAKVNRYLAEQRSPLANLFILSALLLVGLVGLSLAVPYFGILFIPVIFFMFSGVTFLQSTYINHEVDSSLRATMLSFRGLATNLGMAAASQAYAILVVRLKEAEPATLTGKELQDTVFIKAIPYFPIYYLILLAMLLIGGAIFIRRKSAVMTVPNKPD